MAFVKLLGSSWIAHRVDFHAFSWVVNLVVPTLAIAGCASVTGTLQPGTPTTTPTPAESASSAGSDPAAASTLLTIAQVNATILAFMLGLAIIALQMASRYAIPDLKLRIRGTWFLLLYATAGVFAPLFLSLRPSNLAALTLSVVSLVCVAYLPRLVSQNMQAGLPRHIAQRASRLAKRRRPLRRRVDRLSRAHQTLVALQADTSPGRLRDEIQSHIQELLAQTLSAPPANEVATSIVKDLLEWSDGGDLEPRLKMFYEWLRDPRNLRLLCHNQDAAQQAWNSLTVVALRATLDRLDAKALATQAAATVGASRVRRFYLESPAWTAARDDWGDPLVSIADLARSDLDQVLGQAADLTSLILNETPASERGRGLFEAACSILTETTSEIRLGSDFRVGKPLTVASEIYDRLAVTTATEPEAQARMKALMRLPMSMLKTAQKCGCLNTTFGREVLSEYLSWIDKAVEQRNKWLVHELVDELETGVKSRFGTNDSLSRSADSIAVTGLLASLAQDLGRVAAQLMLWHRLGEGPISPYLWFDVSGWVAEDDRGRIGRLWLPHLEQEYLEEYFKRADEILDYLPDNPDSLHDWLPLSRPDVALAVILARWRRTLDADLKMRSLVDKDASGEVSIAAALADTPWAHAIVREWKVATRLLRSAVEVKPGPPAPGAASQTLQDWKSAAGDWLIRPRPFDEPNPDTGAASLVSEIRCVSQEPYRIAADFREPIEISTNDYLRIVWRTSVWKTVFGWGEDFGWRDPLKRGDFPQRTYYLIPQTLHWDEQGYLVPLGITGKAPEHYWYYVVAVEEDDSVRVLVEENKRSWRAWQCEESIPFSHRYLPQVILSDCLGDLGYCTTCFGVDEDPSQNLNCPACSGNGHLQEYGLICDAAWAFAKSKGQSATPKGEPIVFTSSELRQFLAGAVEALGEAKRPQEASTDTD